MCSSLRLNDNFVINSTKSTFVIAEIGQNHQGDFETAKKLIKIAKECGADCVKFQKTDLGEKFNKAALNTSYNTTNSWGKTYGEHKKRLEFSEHQFIQLQKFAQETDILFTASAMDTNSLSFLVSINVPFIKIGSGDANNFLLIEEAAKKNIPLIISTGMQTLETVRKIYQIVSTFHKNFAILHCISSYPTPYNDICLNVIKLYKKEFPDVVVGYSGHEVGIHISVCAVALGAKVKNIIERHITLDKNQKGSDHKSSLTPDEFKELISNIRTLEIALGKEQKIFQQSELNCYEKLGKTIVAGKNLIAGSQLHMNDLKIKVAVPKGIDGIKIYDIVGKMVKRNIEIDESILEEDIE